MNGTNKLLFSMLLGILLFFSCNLFEPKSIDPGSDKYYMTGEAWVQEGLKKIREDDWSAARECFAIALEKDSALSEAHFYYGKCLLRENNVDLNDVWDEIKPKIDTTTKHVPFLYKPPKGKSIITKLKKPYRQKIQGITYTARDLGDSVFLDRKRIYDVMTTAAKHLEYIHSRPTDGRITREQYESDYLVEMSVKMVLGMVDANSNGILDWGDDDDIAERKAFKTLCGSIVDLDNLDFDSLSTLSKDPREINKHIDDVLSTVLKADTSYDNFHADLKKGKNLDTNMAVGVKSTIGQLKIFLPYYYYDDFKDNDGDYYNTTGNKDEDGNDIQDRMIWIDWDRDEKIDVDENGFYHIGDSAHVANNPEKYDFIDGEDDQFKRFRYKGGHTYEFIAGDWGVDEEIMDGEDNDNDGNVDEDMRVVADTLDDDGDYYDTNGDKKIQPMSWFDQRPYDFKIAVTTTSDQWKSVEIKDNYVEIHKDDYRWLDDFYDWIKWPSGNRIEKYVGGYDDSEFKQADNGDYGVDEEMYDGLDNDGDGLIDEDVNEELPAVGRTGGTPDPVKRRELLRKLEEMGLR